MGGTGGLEPVRRPLLAERGIDLADGSAEIAVAMVRGVVMRDPIGLARREEIYAQGDGAAADKAEEQQVTQPQHGRALAVGNTDLCTRIGRGGFQCETPSPSGRVSLT